MDVNFRMLVHWQPRFHPQPRTGFGQPHLSTWRWRLLQRVHVSGLGIHFNGGSMNIYEYDHCQNRKQGLPVELRIVVDVQVSGLGCGH